MNRAKSLLASLRGTTLFGRADSNTVASLKEAAEIWRAEGKYLNAGFVMSMASQASWGNGEEVDTCTRQAIDDYLNAVNTAPIDSHEGLVALTKLRSEMRWFEGNPHITAFAKSLDTELTQRLVSLSIDSNHRAACLVTGVQIGTDFDGPWQPMWPGEVAVGVSGPASFGVTFGSHAEGSAGESAWVVVPGAFRRLLRATDYKRAFEIIEACPEEFTSVSVAGWKPALEGLLGMRDPGAAFDDAAKLFAADTAPEDPAEILRRGGWSSANVFLWAKYFRALSLLERAKADVGRAAEFVAAASLALEGTDSGMVDSQVSRLRVIIRAVAGMLGVSPSLSPTEARKELAFQARIFGQQDGDDLGIQFFAIAERALDRFEQDQARALADGDLQLMLASLAKLPVVGPELADAIRPALGEAALRTMQGPIRTWVHRALEAIPNEATLRQVLLRLIQASGPFYAQIRHGPIEYGKDIAVVEKEGTRTLRLYQAKLGDISVAVWRNAQHELEEMFLVPLASIQIQEPVTEREGILVCNGHANPYVEPTIGPWIDEQARAHGRRFRFMHLDDLVNWIVGDRLVNELRAIADELGLPTS